MAKKKAAKKVCGNPECRKGYGLNHRKKTDDYRCKLCGWEGKL